MKKNWLEKLGHGIGSISATLIAVIVFLVILVGGIKLLSWLWWL